MVKQSYFQKDFFDIPGFYCQAPKKKNLVLVSSYTVRAGKQVQSGRVRVRVELKRVEHPPTWTEPVYLNELKLPTYTYLKIKQVNLILTCLPI